MKKISSCQLVFYLKILMIVYGFKLSAEYKKCITFLNKMHIFPVNKIQWDLYQQIEFLISSQSLTDILASSLCL